MDTIRCRPVDTWDEIFKFVEEPPAWGALTIPLQPHSKHKIRNSEVNANFQELHLENPQAFCHFREGHSHPPLHAADSLPRTLLCHDFANGYHDDCYLDGTPAYDTYTFHNWAAIDSFCYFSHHLVTIPPLGWINAAHLHGVKVLGTLITEWTEGGQFWVQALASEQDMARVVDALTNIATACNFDGWLLNVECKVSEPARLLQFVRSLHTALHAARPHAELLWYDSVTIEGDLHWQNQLNDQNEAFFAACDGLFVNYSWSPLEVKTSALKAAETGRQRALYIGLDVWGRNFYGGGMYNTQAALKVVHSAGASCAIFAPAWTLEAMDPEEYAGMDRYQQWTLRDRALWDSLWPLLTIQLPCQLPFSTSFCRGQGKARWQLGQLISGASWFNLRHMQYQPNANHGPHGYVLSTQEKLEAAREQANGIYRLRASVSVVLSTPPPSLQQSLTQRPGEEKKKTLLRETSKYALDGAAPAASAKRPPGPPYSINQLKQDERKHSLAGSAKVSVDGQLRKSSLVRRTDSSQNYHVSRSASGHSVSGHSVSGHSASGHSASDHPSRAGSSSSSRGGGVLARMCCALRALFPCREPSHSSRLQRLHEYNAHTRAPPVRPESDAEKTPAVVQRQESSPEMRASTGLSMMHMPLRLQLGADKTKLTLAMVEDECECLQVDLSDAFNGGSCLRLHPSDAGTDHHRTIRLFLCDFTARAVAVVVVTKTLPGHEEQTLNLMLHQHGQQLPTTLIGNAAPPGPSPKELKYPLCVEHESFHRLQEHLMREQPGFYVPVKNTFGWTISYYTLDLKLKPMTGVNLRTGMQRGAILLGHFGICPIPLELLIT